jgi:2-dehydro-3-deoxygluconokinase
MYDLVTFGEAMIRMSPPDFKRLEQTTTLDLNTSVVYDRADSSFSNIQPGEIDWEKIFKSSKCLHLTGITPAVSKSSVTGKAARSGSAIAANRESTYTTRTFNIEIVDQVGRGDSFAAGFLYGVLGKNNVQTGLDYGVAFAALKHSFPGDFNWSTKTEVEVLLTGTSPGVQR